MPFIAIFKSVKELQSLSFLVFCYTLNKVLNELRKWYCIQNVYFYQFDRFVNDAIYSDFQKCQGVAVFAFLGFLLYIEKVKWTMKMIFKMYTNVTFQKEANWKLPYPRPCKNNLKDSESFSGSSSRTMPPQWN